MGRQAIKDNHGHTIGYIEESSGRQKITDQYGHTLGYYDERANKTTDSYGHTIGPGNQLMRLL